MNRSREIPGSGSKREERVVVAMSGGVDSSVAAALLVRQGYEVIGVMMRLWSEPGGGAAGGSNRCCTPDQMADARRVARLLGIPFYVIDVQDHFRKTIVQFFIDGHSLGRTPNPCVECNREIRFKHLLKHALAMDADFLATGHYARVRGHQGRFQLLKGIDASKDQSYALHVLGQEQLSRALFPVGEYGKEEVRGLASTFDLPVAFKGESQDLCFLSDGDYRRFLREREASTASPGPILDQSGAKLGQHEGLPFYTIGQRKGLGISAATPLFVLRKEVERNALVVGPREQLGRRALVAQELNWISGSPPKESARVQVKIRAHAKPVWATVSVHGRERIRVDFDEPVQGVTPGQSAVLYDGEICLGGGVISL